MHNELKDIERNLAEQHLGYLDALMDCWAIPLHLHKQVSDVHSTVYGTSSGRRQANEGIEIRGIVTGDEFEPSTSVLSGSFNGGFMYSTYECINTGDHIHIESDDEKTRIFVVTEKESLGSTVEIFYRYKISAKGTRVEEV